MQWLCCCPPPSLPCFAPEPTWQALYADLFLNCFWFLCGTSCRGAESREQRQDVWWLCQPCPAWPPHSLAQNVEAASSTRFLSSSQRERVCICPWVRGEKKKNLPRRKRKEKERIKVLIVKHLLVPGGNESRVISEIIDGNVTEVHFPAAH